MKRKELDKYKGKSLAQLRKDIPELKEKLWDAKQSIIKGKEKNTLTASALRRNIAQVMTILKQKEKEEFASAKVKANESATSKAREDKLAKDKESK